MIKVPVSDTLPTLYEVGQYLVLKPYRTTFAAFKINNYLTEEVATGTAAPIDRCDLEFKR